MLKFFIILVFAIVASSEEFGENGLQFTYGSEYAPKYQNYEPRDYQFNYGVSDPHTGDHKSQWEVREKGVVRGAYSLLEPDGTTRIVEYVADDHGFRAIVKKIGTAIHPEHVETHGHHVEAPVIREKPVVYHAYDGKVENYANVLEPSIHHLQPVQQPIEIPHSLHGYQPQLIQPKVSLEKNPIVYYGQDENIATPKHNLNQNFVINPLTYHPKVELEQNYENLEVIQPKFDNFQYHGINFNPDDDSSYTNYDDHYGYNQAYENQYSASIPSIASIPFHQKLSKPFHYVINHSGN